MTTALRSEQSLAAAGAPTHGVVRIDGVTKRYQVRRGWRETLRHPRSGRTTLALDHVSLEIGRGEFFGLLGPNGAGKTTLFKVLATLIEPEMGTAFVEGHDVRLEPGEVRRALTPVIADERSLNWRLTARENLELFAVLLDVPRAECRERIDRVLADVGLLDVGEKMVGAFSSGMRQRLLIARALLSRPRVLLLDEPTRSLDPVSARTFRAFLREEIVGRHGCTVLLATHNADEAFELCDRVAVLDRGRVLACGAARALAQSYGDERHRVWTRTPAHPAFDALVKSGLVDRLHRLPDEEDGWGCLELVVHGGLAESAAALRALSTAGVSVARFERVPLSLADLIERVVADGAVKGGEAHA